MEVWENPWDLTVAKLWHKKTKNTVWAKKKITYFDKSSTSKQNGHTFIYFLILSGYLAAKLMLGKEPV